MDNGMPLLEVVPGFYPELSWDLGQRWNPEVGNWHGTQPLPGLASAYAEGHKSIGTFQNGREARAWWFECQKNLEALI